MAVSQSSPACPAWCAKSGEHDTHTRHFPGGGKSTEDTYVSLILDGSWDAPRVLVWHGDSAPSDGMMLARLADAADLAELLARLGHKTLANVIRQAVGVGR